MAEFGTRDDMPEIADIAAAIITAHQGRPAAAVAQAALDVAFFLYAADPNITQDDVLAVVTSQIQSRFKRRAN